MICVIVFLIYRNAGHPDNLATSSILSGIFNSAFNIGYVHIYGNVNNLLLYGFELLEPVVETR